MHATVQDIHHRNGQGVGVWTAEVGIEREAGGDGCGILFVKGRQLKKLPYDELLPALLEYIEKL